MKKFIVFFLVIICCLSTSCEKSAESGPSAKTKIVKPICYGNGVYYFPCTDQQFAMSLSAFLSDSTKYIQAFAGDGTGTVYGANGGFFVVVDLPDPE